MTAHRRGFQWRLWGAPIVLGVVSAVGLVAAPLGDGAYDAVSWLGLGLPVAVSLWFGWGRRAKASPAR